MRALSAQSAASFTSSIWQVVSVVRRLEPRAGSWKRPTWSIRVWPIWAMWSTTWPTVNPRISPTETANWPVFFRSPSAATPRQVWSSLAVPRSTTSTRRYQRCVSAREPSASKTRPRSTGRWLFRSSRRSTKRRSERTSTRRGGSGSLSELFSTWALSCPVTHFRRRKVICQTSPRKWSKSLRVTSPNNFSSKPWNRSKIRKPN